MKPKTHLPHPFLLSKIIFGTYENIGKEARHASVNYIDETSHRKKGKLEWLWVIANTAVAFFMIHPKRSKKAFEVLKKDWRGILVTDGIQSLSKIGG